MEKNIELTNTTKYSTLYFKKPTSYEGMEKKKVRNPRRFRTQYPDRESNSELSFRRALLYPFNYQGVWFSDAKINYFLLLSKLIDDFLLAAYTIIRDRIVCTRVTIISFNVSSLFFYLKITTTIPAFFINLRKYYQLKTLLI